MPSANIEASSFKNDTTSFPGLDVTLDGKLLIITLNVPKKKNALTPEMYHGIMELLKIAEKNEQISMVALTGSGDFYSSGNDFAANFNQTSSDVESSASGLKNVQNFVDTLIDFSKPIVAVLNGPAVGITVTTLALMDAVYASDQAWLHTPFTDLGLCAEGCSSYTFPKIMGHLKATEMLLFNTKITALEAERLGLVTKVYPKESLSSIVWPRLKMLAELPRLSLVKSKNLCRASEREILHQVNKTECEQLASLSKSEDTMMAMAKWFSRHSKL